MIKRFSNESIVAILHKSGNQENEVLKYLYKYINQSLMPYLLKKGVTVEEIEDIIQNAIIVAYENIKNGKLNSETDILAYIFSTGKYMWYKSLRHNKKMTMVSVEQSESNIKEEDNIANLFDEKKVEFANSLMELLGDSCKKILLESIYQRIPVKEIAKLNNYKNEQIVRNKKSRCLKKLRILIQKTPNFRVLINDIFYE